MMKSFSIYRLSDGSFTGCVYTVPEADIGINTPEGHAAAEGAFDHLSQRLDIERFNADLETARAAHRAHVERLQLAHEQERKLQLALETEISDLNAAIANAPPESRDGDLAKQLRLKKQRLNPVRAFVEPTFTFIAQAHHVIDWRPSQPSADHEWNDDTRRWQLTAVAQERLDADRLTRLELMNIDSGAIRALIDHVLGDPEAKSRLEAIQALKAAKRSSVVQRD